MRGRASGWIILVLILAAGCGREEVADGYAVSPVVELGVSPRIRGDSLIVQGTASLPEGARLRYVVRHENAALAERYEAQEGHAEVSQGRFRTSHPLSGTAPGLLLVRVEFRTGGDPSQPSVVREVYGERGERMSGRVVQEDGAGNYAAAERSVQWSGWP